MRRLRCLTAVVLAAANMIQGRPRPNEKISFLPTTTNEKFSPHPENLDITDVLILNYSLYLENLSAAFYKEGLAKYSQDDFINAGFDASFYRKIQDILADEEEHVQFFTSALEALNEESLSECTYTFPYTDVQSFVTLATMIEGIGISAYLGEASRIANTTLQIKTAGITVAEADHLSQDGNKVGIKTSSAFGLPPLDLNPVFSLAGHFVTSCPFGSSILPLDTFPTLLEKSSGPYNHVDKNKVTFAFSGIDGTQHYVIWFTSYGIFTVPVSTLSTSRFEVEIPPSEHIKGQIYAVLTDTDVTQENIDVDDSIMVAGPNTIWVE